MLVLSRKQGQEIMIGDGIIVSVQAVGRDKVKLGIVAPLDVPILRRELAEPSGSAPPTVHGAMWHFPG